MATESTVIDGLVYERTDKGYDFENKRFIFQAFWTLRISFRNEKTGKHQKQDDQGKPHVVCDCGNSEFTLRYGDYEILARCTRCGAEESVYSG